MSNPTLLPSEQHDASTQAARGATFREPQTVFPKRISWQALEPYAFLAIPLGLMGLFLFWPTAMAVGMSLLDYHHDLYAPQWVGWSNYQQLFQSVRFWNALVNTGLFSLGVVPAMVLIPIVMALLVNGTLRGMALFRTLLYLPVVVSMVVVGIAWKWLYAEQGLINYWLANLGFAPVDWLVNPDVALLAVMLVVIWKGLAYYMMMYLANLQTVSQDLYEAASIDGANLWQRHWFVTLPHLAPTMSMVALISTIGCLKVFTEMYVMTRGGPLGRTQTLVYYIYERAFEHLDLGVATAAGLVLMAILMVLSLLQVLLTGLGESSSDQQKIQAHRAV
ncbi:MAG: sugar ABC transporter permease [Candidatus Melainabacteria bacterium]|nr:sugar ABC transporter permease [Candidatus Melainabacteria bacterium]